MVVLFQFVLLPVWISSLILRLAMSSILLHLHVVWISARNWRCIVHRIAFWHVNFSTFVCPCGRLRIKKYPWVTTPDPCYAPDAETSAYDSIKTPRSKIGYLRACNIHPVSKGHWKWAATSFEAHLHWKAITDTERVVVLQRYDNQRSLKNTSKCVN